MAAACHRGRGIPDVSFFSSAVPAAGGAGGVIFGGVGQDRQLLQNIHDLPGHSTAAGPTGGTFNSVDDAEQLGGQGGNTHQNKEKAPSSHCQFLLVRTYVLHIL